MKKWCCWILALCMVLTVLPTNSAFADNYGDLNYYIEDGEVIISWCNHSATGTVEIPASIDGYPVTTIRDEAFRGCHEIESIVIPRSVLLIEEGAFYDCSVSEVLVEDGNPAYNTIDGVLYTSDRKTVMYYPRKDIGATSYTIPSGVTKIAEHAFSGRNGLETIEIPNTVTEIGDYAFFNSQLKRIDLPASVTTLGYGVFYDCYSLEKASIPGLTVLETSTFLDCYSLSEIVLPDSLERIEGQVFFDTAISSITIPRNVTEIDGGAFVGMDNLESVQVDPRNTSFVMKDGVLYSADGKTLVSGCNKSGNYTIPEGTETILNRAFSGCSLTGVSLPGSLRSIGEDAFLLTNITSLTIPGSVNEIDFDSFAKCSELRNVVIQEGVEIISGYAFDECSNLTQITIPKSVTSIRNDAFSDCDSLSDVYYAGSQEDWEQIFIDVDNGSKNAALLNATFHYNIPIFTDVKADEYYAEPVAWAVEEGITLGTSETTFSPDLQCTRAQVVTFLWRANGSPKASMENPFVDVKESDWFYEAVLWAVENGITLGTSATTFSPNDSCTRAQVVTFQWRENSSVTASTKNPFKDVQRQAFYYEAVLWAVNRGVTNGTSETTFSPDDTCTRAQVVTFLYRDMA